MMWTGCDPTGNPWTSCSERFARSQIVRGRLKPGVRGAEATGRVTVHRFSHRAWNKTNKQTNKKQDDSEVTCLWDRNEVMVKIEAPGRLHAIDHLFCEGDGAAALHLHPPLPSERNEVSLFDRSLPCVSGGVRANGCGAARLTSCPQTRLGDPNGLSRQKVPDRRNSLDIYLIRRSHPTSQPVSGIDPVPYHRVLVQSWLFFFPSVDIFLVAYAR